MISNYFKNLFKETHTFNIILGDVMYLGDGHIQRDFVGCVIRIKKTFIGIPFYKKVNRYDKNDIKMIERNFKINQVLEPNKYIYKEIENPLP